MKVNELTVNLLSSLLEIFATARSALATYAISMAVTGGDQTFSIFTTAVVEGALVLSLLAIGIDPVSPLTAIAALVFSAVMQYVEVQTLQGGIDPETKRVLTLSLAFAPSVLLALAILRRLKSSHTGVDVFTSLGDVFRSGGRKASKSYGFTVDSPKLKSGKTWVESRRLVRWRDASGRKRSKHLPTVGKRKRSKR